MIVYEHKTSMTVVGTSANSTTLENVGGRLMYVLIRANTTATAVTGVEIANCKASTNLQYAFDYTSVGSPAMQFNLHIKVEAL